MNNETTFTSSFKQLSFLPIFENIDKILLEMIESNILHWNKHGQICINTIDGQESNYELGTGSLTFNWDELKIQTEKNGNTTLHIPSVTNTLDAREFKLLCTQFKDTIIEKVYNALDNNYILGRVRFMRSSPKTCLSWHVDSTPRVHFPLITQDGCLMVVDNEVMHLPKNTWWEVDTTKHHTAFNGSLNTRIHLVAEVFGRK